MTKQKKIDPDKWYWLYEVHREGIIPFIKSFQTLKKWAEKGYLRTTIYGTAHGKRYALKGKNIIKFIAKWEAGDFKR